MKKIGFSNFRRFVEFPNLEYGPITFLVGKNNAGKSTVVKALMLINSYLKSSNMGKLDFAGSVLEEINVISFGRAKNKNSNSSTIKFLLQVDSFEIRIEITGGTDDTQAKVYLLHIDDQSTGFFFKLEPAEEKITIGKRQLDTQQKNGSYLQTLKEEYKKLEKQVLSLKNKNNLYEYMRHFATLNQIKDRIDMIEQGSKMNINYNMPNNRQEFSNDSYELSIDFNPVNRLSDIIDPILYELTNMYVTLYNPRPKNQNNDNEWRSFNDILNPNNSKNKLSKEEYQKFMNLRGFYMDKFKIRKVFKKFTDLVLNDEIYYLGAFSSKQNTLLSIKDKTNPLAQVLHEYKQLHIEKNEASTAHTFTKKWMKELEIGDNLDIIMHAGEAYEVTITQDNMKIPLADKGMGSIQAMLLILRLACIIAKNESREANITVVVEEPEINLHPALQSKITDMLMHVNELKTKKEISCNIEFIIETHSEYIIRRSQVLIAENELQTAPNSNPFVIHYFPKENPIYRIEYNTDGSLKTSFEKGFYDESSSMTLAIMRHNKNRSK